MSDTSPPSHDPAPAPDLQAEEASRTKPDTLLSASGRSGAILLAFSLVFTAMMALTYNATRSTIDASREEQKMALIGEILPRSEHDNALLDDFVTVEAAAALGQSEPVRVFRARRNGELVALVFEAFAPDGYSGRIRLLMAVRSNGSLAGVRVIEHKETPGLGDYIDPRKDKHKDRPWISQFADASVAHIALPQWTVKKDGGAFDYMTGATISARAVSRAAGRAMAFITAHAATLGVLPAGATLPTEDTP